MRTDFEPKDGDFQKLAERFTEDAASAKAAGAPRDGSDGSAREIGSDAASSDGKDPRLAAGSERRRGGDKNTRSEIRDAQETTRSKSPERDESTEDRSDGKSASKIAFNIVLNLILVAFISMVLAFKTVEYGLFMQEYGFMLHLEYLADGEDNLFLAFSALYFLLFLIVFRLFFSRRSKA